MEQLILEWQNVELLLKYISTFVLGILAFFGYLKQAGIKLASVEKVLEYRQIKDNFGFISKYISISEVVAIAEFLSKESEKAGKITPEIKEKAFDMFVEALKTKESGHP